MEILRVAYEIAVIVLALMVLIGSLIVAVIFAGLAYLIHRGGNIAVLAARLARLRVAMAEVQVQRALLRGVVWPAALAHGWVQWLSTFGKRTLDEP